MKVFEMTSKLGTMPSDDDIVVRFTDGEGNSSEHKIGNSSIIRDYVNNKTEIEVRI